MWFLFLLVIAAVRVTGRSRADLMLENVALRHQLAVYRRSRRRVRLTEADRRLWSTLARSGFAWREALVFVHADTVVRWHRSAWRRHWAWKSRRRGTGRPRLDRDTQALIRRMARENPRWGAVRIVGALRLVGIEVSASTVRVYRRQALRRPPSPQWRTFLRLHAPEIWASDFFTVQTWTFRTLYVFIVISHERRRIEHWNVTADPSWRSASGAPSARRIAPKSVVREVQGHHLGRSSIRAAQGEDRARNDCLAEASRRHPIGVYQIVARIADSARAPGWQARSVPRSALPRKAGSASNPRELHGPRAARRRSGEPRRPIPEQRLPTGPLAASIDPDLNHASERV